MLIELAGTFLVALSGGYGGSWVKGRFDLRAKKLETDAKKDEIEQGAGINAAAEFHKRVVDLETKCAQLEARERLCQDQLWEAKEDLQTCFHAIEYLSKDAPEAAREIEEYRNRMARRRTHRETADNLQRQLENGGS